MKLGRKDRSRCRAISDECAIPEREVAKAVESYFDSIVEKTRRLPFDTPKRIYSREAFRKCSFVVNIPYIGRIGPVYSRYLKWRAAESEGMRMVRRDDVKSDHFRPLVEKAAKDALSGMKVDSSALVGRIPKGRYEKVWIVNPDGSRRSARQLISKDDKH